jgi:hypothetical protein
VFWCEKENAKQITSTRNCSLIRMPEKEKEKKEKKERKQKERKGEERKNEE